MTAVKVLVLIVGGLAVCAACFVSYAWQCAAYQADVLDGDLRAHIDGDGDGERDPAGRRIADHADRAIGITSATRPPPDRHRDDLGHTAARRRAEIAALKAIPTRAPKETP